MARRAPKAEGPEQLAVMDIISALRRNPHMMKVAADLTLLSTDDQRKVAELCFNLIGMWSEWADLVSPENPLWNEYLTSKRMVEGLFDNVNSGGKHRASA